MRQLQPNTIICSSRSSVFVGRGRRDAWGPDGVGRTPCSAPLPQLILPPVESLVRSRGGAWRGQAAGCSTAGREGGACGRPSESRRGTMRHAAVCMRAAGSSSPSNQEELSGKEVATERGDSHAAPEPADRTAASAPEEASPVNLLGDDDPAGRDQLRTLLLAGMALL